MSQAGRRPSGDNSFFSATHSLGGKKTIWNRSASGVCQKHCPSPLHLQAGPWQNVMTFSSSYNFLKRNTEATLANFSSNQEYVGWVTCAPFTALQLCKLNYCAWGSQFIKWGCELSASLTYYNNSSIKANNAWERCKVILWNRRREPYSSEFPLRESGLTKCSCQIRKRVITPALFLISKRQLCKAFALTFPVSPYSCLSL